MNFTSILFWNLGQITYTLTQRESVNVRERKRSVLKILKEIKIEIEG